jgi:hypothetical protein
VLKATPDQLRPDTSSHYDLDQVYEWASGEPDPVHVSALADVVDMVGKIADCCDDGALRRLVEGTPEYAELVDEDVSYQGKDGRKRWNQLGDTIADSWERAIKRVEDWLSWQGDFTVSEFSAEESVWERVGAAPIQIQTAETTYLTVRGEILADVEGDETEVAFLGTEGDVVVVFSEVADLARYCRTAEEHELHKLEWWEELADVEDDDVFAPMPEASYDLRKPSERGAQLLGELAAFCQLAADTELLDEPVDKNTDRDDWLSLVAEVETCLQVQD